MKVVIWVYVQNEYNLCMKYWFWYRMWTFQFEKDVFAQTQYIKKEIIALGQDIYVELFIGSSARLFFR